MAREQEYAMVSRNIRDTQFAEFAKLLAGDLPYPSTNVFEWREQVALIIARRVYDLLVCKEDLKEWHEEQE